jgi:two-component system nitrate/nitrite response regulator NarL
MKVLLIDIVKHVLFMQGLQSILQSGGVDVVGTALNGEEALSKAGSLKPDVVILNTSENVGDSLKTIHRVRRKIPAARIIAFADGEENVRATEVGGASVYLLSEIKSKELLNKLREIEMGAMNH